MDSFSKIPLTVEMIELVVKSYFGSRRSVSSYQELKEGFYNAAARFELDDGLKCVLKAAPPPTIKVLQYEHDILRAEKEAYQLVRSKTEVPVPEVYCFDNSRSLLPSDFFIMQYLPGVPFHKLRATLSPEKQASVEQEMGRMTRQISQVTGPAFGYWAQPETQEAGWRNCFDSMLQGVLKDGQAADVQLPLPYDEIYSLFQAHFAALDEVKTPRMVHWDLWDGNVIVDPESGRINGLIDFERVMWADPLIEMIFTPMRPTSHQVLGFGQPVFDQPHAYQRRLLYNGYLFLIMIIECYYRHYPTNDQENWARKMLDRTIAAIRAWPAIPEPLW